MNEEVEENAAVISPTNVDGVSDVRDIGVDTNSVNVNEPPPQRNSVNQRLKELAQQNPVPDDEQRRSPRHCHYFSNYGKCLYEERTERRCKFDHKKAPYVF